MVASQSEMFRPTVWRYAAFRYVRLLAAYVLLATAGVALRGLGAIDSGILALLLAVFVIAALIGELLRARVKVPGLYIAFLDDRVEGPTGRAGQRAGFAIARVDTERTCRDGAWRWLTGRRPIWSLDGERIQFDTSGFTAAETQAILARVGCTR